MSDSTRLPNNTDTSAECAAKVNNLAAMNQGHGIVIYGDRTDSRGYTDDTAAQAVAVFHLVRGDYWWFGLKSGSNTLNATTAALSLTDYGNPMGKMTQSGSVFSREYQGATIQLDCSTFTATFSPKQGWEQAHALL